MPPVTVRVLSPGEASDAIGPLSDVLLDCVADGASVSFMADITRREAEAFWSRVAAGVADGSRVLVVAEEAGRILGTVQAVAAGVPNQPHRADLAKMLVRRDARGRGIGAALLAEAERRSAARGWWLMVLDTVVDSAGDRLYARAGWKPVGVIPDFALWPDGRLCATKYYYKDLRAGGS
jgi:GNAT superfamily N-acetyltransferase